MTSQLSSFFLEIMFPGGFLVTSQLSSCFGDHVSGRFLHDIPAVFLLLGVMVPGGFLVTCQRASFSGGHGSGRFPYDIPAVFPFWGSCFREVSL